MSVDLEDYYVRSPYQEWDKCESRVVNSTRVLLDLFEKYNVNATFFTLGYIANRHPEIIEEIASKGHEIASHGYYHNEVKHLKPKQFEDDLIKSLKILKKTSGETPLGFRAPRFSINKESLWAFKILKKHLLYDSSIIPSSYVKYGMSNASRKIYKPSDSDPLKNDEKSNFIEIPLATMKIPGFGNLPIAGGFYLRFLPMHIIRFGIRQLNHSGITAMCYIHPHDLDPGKPHLQGYPWHVYWNLAGAKKKLESLLKNFSFSSVRDVVLTK